MAFTINRIILVGGNLTKDVEVQYTQSGKAVSKFTIAMNRSAGKNPDGSYKEECDFFPVEAWDQPDGLVQRLVKGQKVAVDGMLMQSHWQDKTTGSPQSRTFIRANHVLLIGEKKEGQETRAPQPNKQSGYQGMDETPLDPSDVPWEENF